MTYLEREEEGGHSGSGGGWLHRQAKRKANNASSEEECPWVTGPSFPRRPLTLSTNWPKFASINTPMAKTCLN